MVSSRIGVSGLAAVLSAMIVGPAAAAVPLYHAVVIATVVDANGVQSEIVKGSQSPEAVPVQIGATATDWQVGANATAVHGGTAESNIQAGPMPTVSGVGFAEQLKSTTEVIYKISLGGTASDAFVPVTIGADGTVAWSQNGDVEATFDFEGSSGDLISKFIDENAAGQSRLAGQTSFSVNQVVDLVPGQTYTVVLTTFAESDLNEFQSKPDGTVPFGEDSAVVDPTFTVDPAFASRWTIEGVPVDTSGVGGVPEPATWTLLIAGFGLAGAGLRRRRAPTATGPAL
jgi:PEP-CTERM motif